MQIEIVTWPEIKARPERQRREVPVEHVRALAESISQNGLLHAPVVNADLELIAGDCRRLAIKILIDRQERITYNGEQLPLEYLPVVRTNKSSDKELYQIELEENLRRKNLSQIEEAQAIARLHEFGKSNDPAWTNRQTAEQLISLGASTATQQHTEKEVAEALILSKFSDDPEVKAAATKSSAVRIAKRKMEREFRSLMGEERATASNEKYRVLSGDARELMKALPVNSIDGIITDPPYGMGADTFGPASFLGGAHEYQDDAEYADSCYKELASESYRICREEAHIYVFCDVLAFTRLKAMFTDSGWQVWKTPLIWFKGSVAHAPQPEHGPKRTYETILFAAKGGKRIEKLGPDVLVYNSVSPAVKLHAAEKPVQLLNELISWSFLPGSIILDPFCGSGSIFSAAHSQRLSAIGMELDATNVAISQDRINRLQS